LLKKRSSRVKFGWLTIRFSLLYSWHTNHSLPIGKLHKGYLQPLKKGWKTGCGEYGTEGLDPLSVMLENYPNQWLPKNIKEPWTPEKIIKA